MPATVTHAYFGMDVYNNLPIGLKELLMDEKKSIRMFAQGMDPFFFYHKHKKCIIFQFLFYHICAFLTSTFLKTKKPTRTSLLQPAIFKIRYSLMHICFTVPSKNLTSKCLLSYAIILSSTNITCSGTTVCIAPSAISIFICLARNLSNGFPFSI